jgi:AraC family transcriptional regulator, glycine betaine-responsive activator
MFGQASPNLPHRIAILIVPKFPMMSFTSAIEPLRSANRMSGRALYSWHILSKDGRPVGASNGISILPEASIEAAANFGTIVACAGIDAHLYKDAAVFAWLRRLDRQGADIGAISLGSYLLARAGLLGGYRCTIHWENHRAFSEDFPRLEVTQELFEIDRNRFSCSGGIAALDMMLYLITAQHGHELATAVSEQFIHERIRDRHDRQRMVTPARLGIHHPKLLKVIKRMEENLDDPVSGAKIAAADGLSRRQVERLFQRYLNCSPTRYYLQLRLGQARRLLQQTDRSVTDIGLACGFVSVSHFSKTYRQLFGKSPREERSSA